jgi:glycosyltransferase involved in cell wall biosynthesis
MNILIANKYYFVTGGPERYMFSVIGLLRENGHKVVPFTLKSRENQQSEYDHYFMDSPLGKDITHFDNAKLTILDKIKLTQNAIYSFSAKQKIKQIIKKEDIDVVYLLNICNYLSPSIIDAAKEMNVKVVMRLSDFNFICSSYMYFRDGKPCDLCQQSVLNAVKYKCMRGSLSLSAARAMTITLHRWLGVYKKVDSFIAPSSRMCQALEQFGIPPEKINHIHSFLDTDVYAPSVSNDGYALYFGRLSSEKGVDVIIKAWEILGNQAPKLKIVGSGDEEDRLKNMAASLGLTNIDFLPFTTTQTELIEILSNCAFAIIPSLWEDNSPMAAYEAMSCGKPVIASDLGGLKDQVIDGTTGYLFRYGDSHALANAVKKLYESDGLIGTFGFNARKRMESEFSKENHYKSLMGLLS